MPQNIKEKGKSGLMWTGVLSFIYVAYYYVGLYPYLLFGGQGWDLAFPDMTLPIEYLVTSSKIFIAAAAVALFAKFILGIRKKDVNYDV